LEAVGAEEEDLDFGGCAVLLLELAAPADSVGPLLNAELLADELLQAVVVIDEQEVPHWIAVYGRSGRAPSTIPKRGASPAPLTGRLIRCRLELVRTRGRLDHLSAELV